MLSEKVVPFNQSNVYKDITIYLDDLENYSENTRIAYEKNIRQFFNVMVKKNIEHLKEEDLYFKLNDIIKYRNYLLENGNSPSTANQKIASVKSLYKNLKANEYDVNSSVFDFKQLKSESNQHGSLSQSEADRMAEVALNTEREKGYLKYCLILFATRTSFRLSEILSAKWSDFHLDNGVYRIKLVGKRKKVRETSISEKMYNKLLKLKEIEGSQDDDVVFKISKDSIENMMKRLREKMNIPDERNIVFHSFRNVAIDKELEENGVKAAVQHSGHSSMDTMYKHYINKTRDFTQTPGVRMDEEVDWSLLDDLSIEDFREFVKQGGYRNYIELKHFLNSK